MDEKIDLEDGWFKLANTWAEAFARADLTGVEHAIIWWVIRQTYARRARQADGTWEAVRETGYEIAVMARQLGRDRKGVRAAGQRLCALGILIGEQGKLRLNTRVGSWAENTIKGECIESSQPIPIVTPLLPGALGPTPLGRKAPPPPSCLGRKAPDDGALGPTQTGVRPHLLGRKAPPPENARATESRKEERGEAKPTPPTQDPQPQPRLWTWRRDHQPTRPAWMTLRTWSKRQWYDLRVVSCPDPERDLGQLPDGSRDTPIARAKLGCPDIPPGAHPACRGRSFDELDEYARVWRESVAGLERIADDLTAWERSEAVGDYGSGGPPPGWPCASDAPALMQ